MARAAQARSIGLLALLCSRDVPNRSRAAWHADTLRLPSGATVRSLQPHHVLCGLGTAVALQVEAGHPLTSFPA